MTAAQVAEIRAYLLAKKDQADEECEPKVWLAYECALVKLGGLAQPSPSHKGEAR